MYGAGTPLVFFRVRLTVTVSPASVSGSGARRSSICVAVGRTCTFRSCVWFQGARVAVKVPLPAASAFASKVSTPGLAASTRAVTVVSPAAVKPSGSFTRRLAGRVCRSNSVVARAVKVTTSPTHTSGLSATKFRFTLGLTCTSTRAVCCLTTVTAGAFSVTSAPLIGSAVTGYSLTGTVKGPAAPRTS